MISSPRGVPAGLTTTEIGSRACTVNRCQAPSSAKGTVAGSGDREAAGPTGSPIPDGSDGSDGSLRYATMVQASDRSTWPSASTSPREMSPLLGRTVLASRLYRATSRASEKSTRAVVVHVAENPARGHLRPRRAARRFEHHLHRGHACGHPESRVHVGDQPPVRRRSTRRPGPSPLPWQRTLDRPPPSPACPSISNIRRVTWWPALPLRR